MEHDRLAAEDTEDGAIAAACSCGSWRCTGPTAHSVAEQWDRHRAESREERTG